MQFTGSRQDPVAVTEHVSAKLRLELAGNKGIVNPVCSPATVGDAGQVAPPAAEQVRLEHANPVAEGSVSTAPSAALGPLLGTTMVYTVAEPDTTVLAMAVLEILSLGLTGTVTVAWL